MPAEMYTESIFYRAREKALRERLMRRRLLVEKIKVLIADDSTVVLEVLSSYLQDKEDIEVVGTAEDGLQVMDILRSKPVDVLLLDMVMPRLDGFGVLAQIQKENLPHRPHIIAVTALMRDDFIQRAINLGSDYYILKPFELSAVYQRIVERNQPVEVQADAPVRAPQPANCSLDERIANIFLSMGIPAHIKGYHFLREAIKLVVNDREMINAITKDLYPTVALNFNTTSSKVERAIRHAIDVAWTRGQMENINMLFGSKLYVKHEKPTNGEFIALIADRLAIEKSA